MMIGLEISLASKLYYKIYNLNELKKKKLELIFQIDEFAFFVYQLDTRRRKQCNALYPLDMENFLKLYY